MSDLNGNGVLRKTSYLWYAALMGFATFVAGIGVADWNINKQSNQALVDTVNQLKERLGQDEYQWRSVAANADSNSKRIDAVRDTEQSTHDQLTGFGFQVNALQKSIADLGDEIKQRIKR